MNKISATFLLAFCLHKPSTNGQMRQIEILTSLNFNLSLSNDVVATGGAFDLAASNANGKYAGRVNVSVRHFYNASHRTCNDVAAQAVQMIAEYYFRQEQKRDTCYALVTSPCNDILGITSLSKGLGLLLLYNTLSKNDFLDPKDGPSNSIAIGGTNRGYCRAMLDILGYFKWFHVTVIIEGASIVPFYKNIGGLLVETSLQSPLPFALESYIMKPIPPKIFDKLFGLRSKRVEFMADQLDVANGDYVFLNLQPLQGETYGATSHFALDDNEHNISSGILKAFRSLLFIAYHPVTQEARQLSSAIARRSEQLFNVPIKNGSEPLDSFPTQASYDIVELFAALTNETAFSQENGLDCDGFRLARRSANRTFDLSTGRMFVNQGQARNLDLDIFGFNSSTSHLQAIGTYEWAKPFGRRLDWRKDAKSDWPTVDHKSPSDIPPCGFSGQEGACVDQSSSSSSWTTIVPVAVVIILLGLGFAFWWTNLSRTAPSPEWWLLLSEQILIRQFEATSNYALRVSNIPLPRRLLSKSKIVTKRRLQ
ncbi:hypothetical protein BV898_16837 [Hypsibius exemplaris]|uniref:Receptor ligand binding region domain-containing protein n=1 Tax=Hypsibius exemplaris TaxID=2072580 RepID=A0A9X6NE91_HYPEX|nr:hypothetical protein BV898_16837 [Hypsibius exemplaris]